MLFVGIKNKFISTKNDKRAYGQVCFWKYHSTIDNLAAGWVLLEKSHLREKGLYCGFIGFIKAINMVLNERLWRCMEELGVPNEYMLLISHIGERLCAYRRWRLRFVFMILLSAFGVLLMANIV